MNTEGRKVNYRHNLPGFCCICVFRVFSRYAGVNAGFACSFECNNPIEGPDRYMSIHAF